MYDVNVTRNPHKGDNDDVCLHLWELWMPHLVYDLEYLSTVANRAATTQTCKDVASDVCLRCSCCPRAGAELPLVN